MKIARKHLNSVMEAIGSFDEARRVTKIVSEKLTITATRRHKPNRRESQREILVTIGRPNYANRIVIKRCRTLCKPLPKGLIIQWYKQKGA